MLCPITVWIMGAPIWVLSMLCPHMAWSMGAPIWVLYMGGDVLDFTVLSTLLPIMVSDHDGTI